MQVNEDDLTDVQAVIDGPPGTPYQGDLSTYSSLKYISNKIPPAEVKTYTLKYIPNMILDIKNLGNSHHTTVVVEKIHKGVKPFKCSYMMLTSQ